MTKKEYKDHKPKVKINKPDIEWEYVLLLAFIGGMVLFFVIYVPPSIQMKAERDAEFAIKVAEKEKEYSDKFVLDKECIEYCKLYPKTWLNYAGIQVDKYDYEIREYEMGNCIVYKTGRGSGDTDTEYKWYKGTCNITDMKEVLKR